MIDTKTAVEPIMIEQQNVRATITDEKTSAAKLNGSDSVEEVLLLLELTSKGQFTSGIKCA